MVGDWGEGWAMSLREKVDQKVRVNARLLCTIDEKRTHKIIFRRNAKLKEILGPNWVSRISVPYLICAAEEEAVIAQAMIDAWEYAKRDGEFEPWVLSEQE